MAIINPTMPTGGQPAGGEETDLQNAVQAILGEINGNLDSANIKDGTIVLADLATATGNAFLKLLAAGDHKVAWGTKVLGNLDGTAGRSKASAVQAHGLGGTPVFAIATQMNTIGVTEAAGNHICAIGVQVTSTDMTITAVAPGTSGNSVSVFWLAIS